MLERTCTTLPPFGALSGAAVESQVESWIWVKQAEFGEDEALCGDSSLCGDVLELGRERPARRPNSGRDNASGRAITCTLD